jgi:hypothetical protein
MHYDAVIVGAGFAGLYMLHRLRGLAFSARIYEAGSGLGGTWFWNRYEAEDEWVNHVNKVASQTLFPLANSWYMGRMYRANRRVFMPYVGGLERIARTVKRWPPGTNQGSRSRLNLSQVRTDGGSTSGGVS